MPETGAVQGIGVPNIHDGSANFMNDIALWSNADPALAVSGDCVTTGAAAATRPIPITVRYMVMSMPVTYVSVSIDEDVGVSHQLKANQTSSGFRTCSLSAMLVNCLISQGNDQPNTPPSACRSLLGIR